MLGTSATLQPAIASVCTFVFKKMLSRVGVVCIVVPKDMLAVQKTQRESSPGPVLLPPCLQLIRLGFSFLFGSLPQQNKRRHPHGTFHRSVCNPTFRERLYRSGPFFIYLHGPPTRKQGGSLFFFLLLAEQNRLSVIV